MPSSSLYAKLIESLGERGTLQAAKAEGVAAKSVADIPESILQKIANKAAPAAEETAPALERGPSQAELDAIEKSNAGGYDVAPQFRETAADYAPDSPDVGAQGGDAESRGMAQMLKGMGAKKALAGAGVVGAVGYGASGAWGDSNAGPVKDPGLAGGQVPGSLKDAVAKSTALPPAAVSSTKSNMPGVPIPKVGPRPEDYQAGKYNYDDSSYQQKLKDLQDKEEGAQATYAKNRNTNEWGDVAERVAQAAAQYGAARQGLNSGVDLSGIKMQRGDWAGMTDRDAKDLAMTQHSLGAQRETARDSFGQQQKAAELQFAHDEAAKHDTTAEKFREYDTDRQNANAAKMKAAELAIENAKEQRKRGESLEDFEKRQAIEAKFRAPKESPQAKEAAKKEEALSGLHAAYLQGDEKEIQKQRLAATKYLSPQQANELQEAEGKWFVGHKRAAGVLEQILTGTSPAAPSAPGASAPGSGGFVTFTINGKAGKIPADQADAFQAKHPDAKRVN